MKFKLSPGFIIQCAAVVLTIVAIILYGGSYSTSAQAYAFIIIGAIVGAVSAVGAQKMPRIFNWGTVLSALLLGAGIAFSITVMADPFGYVISGLYTSDTLTGYIVSFVFMMLGWILYMVAGFTGICKEE